MTGDNNGYRRILVATDFSTHADAALKQAVWLARRTGAKVVVAHALPDLRQAVTSGSYSQFPITPELRGMSELLGVDPLYFAGEGVFVLAVARGSSDAALALLRNHPETALARRVGEVQTRDRFAVTIHRGLGKSQPLEEPTAAMLPRIC